MEKFISLNRVLAKEAPRVRPSVKITVRKFEVEAMPITTIGTRLAALAATVVFVALVAGTAASAKPVKPGELPGCNVDSVEGALECAGVFSGNDSNSDLGGLFGQDTWTEVLKLDAGSGTTSGNGITLSVTNTGNGGTWSIDTYAGFAPVMFVTKGGNSYSAFLMDLKTLTGSWDTLSMLKGNGKPGAGLSHWTIYQAGTLPVQPGPGPAPVPLPAGLWFLSAGIAGLSLLRRKAA